MQVPKYTTIFDYINKLRIRLYLMIALPIIAFTFLYLEYTRGASTNKPESINFNTFTNALLIVFFASTIFAAYYFFNKKVKKIRSTTNRKQQLDEYFQASMQEYYIILAGVFAATIAYWLTYNVFFAGFFVGYMFVISLNNPNMYRVFRHLRLNKEARERLIEQHFDNN
ncbi:MAG: hypothetical protein ACOCXH_07355 [Cyclobacteriaceae bacterium]